MRFDQRKQNGLENSFVVPATVMCAIRTPVVRYILLGLSYKISGITYKIYPGITCKLWYNLYTLV